MFLIQLIGVLPFFHRQKELTDQLGKKRQKPNRRLKLQSEDHNTKQPETSTNAYNKALATEGKEIHFKKHSSNTKGERNQDREAEQSRAT
jgi:hypothetical protein